MINLSIQVSIFIQILFSYKVDERELMQRDGYLSKYFMFLKKSKDELNDSLTNRFENGLTAVSIQPPK